VAPVAEAELVIGLIPEQNIFRQLERYEPLAAYLLTKAGVDIELRILPRYGNIVDNFVSSELDGAFFGSFTYALAHEKLGVEVIARPVALDNTSSYHGLIFIRRDSGINGVEGLQGKRFVFVDKATTAGYLLPLEFFHTKGIEDYRTFFGETYFAGTHEDSIYDVLNGRADIGAAKNTVFGRLAAADPRIASELIILARSPDVPENGLALRSDFDPAVVARLKRTLLTMDGDPAGRSVLRQFGALRFIETTTEDYAPVYRYAEKVRLDLATYDYIND
jgi:phosphonate transport system substrate-binding protein